MQQRRKLGAKVTQWAPYGGISKRELYNAIEAAGIRMTNTEKIAAYKYGDADDSGSMEWEEFRQVGLKYKKLTRAMPAVASAVATSLPPVASAGERARVPAP